MHDTCYGSEEFWTLVKSVFPDKAREYAVKIIRTKGLPKGLDESFFKEERLKILQSSPEALQYWAKFYEK
jgi:hypothetical protein